MIKSCIVDSFPQDSTSLKKCLDDGWRVISATPIIFNGYTEKVEYVLERDELK